MQIHRFYCESISQPTTILTGSEVRHINKVLRLNSGDAVELFDGRGTLAKVIVTELSSKKVIFEMKELVTQGVTDRPRIIIAASVAKGERFDWLIAKCTELGVDRIVPVVFERTVKQPKNPRIVDRWQNIVISSAKQCKRLFLPLIDSPTKLNDTVEKLSVDYSNSQILIGSLADDAEPLIKTDCGSKDVIALIGPEGGLTETETDLLVNAGAQSVRITNTILRIETAAVAFASILTAARDSYTS
jgi:16S rRNA (uracil1498-N3)-methyltransferase